MKLGYALRPGGRSSALIKGEAHSGPGEGRVPGFSASGQDVWLDEAMYEGPGLVVSAVGARCGKVFEADGKWGVVANTSILIPQPGHDPHFLWYLVNDEQFWEKGGTAQPYVRVPETLARRVQVPSLTEQRRIADFLDAETARIDAIIVAKQQMNQALLSKRIGVTLAAVAGFWSGSTKQRNSTVPWLRTVPSHWREAKLSLLATLGSGHTPSRSRADWWIDCTVPWITTGEVAQMRDDRVEYIFETREMISEVGMANSSAVLHPAGTVVLCRTASAGYSAIMGRDMAVSQDFATWTCGPELRPRFLLLCLRAMRGDLLGRLATGSTHKTIYMPDIAALRVPVPPVEEQDRIVKSTWRELRRIDDIRTILERQVELLRERRQALITAAVTGEVES